MEQALPLQVDVIKKAYLQEEERENSEVSPREVGHNIYILALQVPVPPVATAITPLATVPRPSCHHPPSRHCRPPATMSLSHHALVTVLPFPSALQAQ